MGLVSLAYTTVSSATRCGLCHVYDHNDIPSAQVVYANDTRPFPSPNPHDKGSERVGLRQTKSHGGQTPFCHWKLTKSIAILLTVTVLHNGAMVTYQG